MEVNQAAQLRGQAVDAEPKKAAAAVDEAAAQPAQKQQGAREAQAEAAPAVPAQERAQPAQPAQQ